MGCLEKSDTFRQWGNKACHCIYIVFVLFIQDRTQVVFIREFSISMHVALENCLYVCTLLCVLNVRSTVHCTGLELEIDWFHVVTDG